MTALRTTPAAPVVHVDDAPILRLEQVDVRRTGPQGTDTIVSRLDLTIAPGETVGIVGESGSGKSITAKTIIGLLPPRFTTSGRITYRGRDLSALTPRQRRSVRGREIGLISQDPFTSLNPVMRCGPIITESLADRRHMTRRQQRAEAVRRLAEVGIDDPSVADRYPFQLSGGMRQRIAIAAALACDPSLLIADEPTTALDAATQSEILALISRIQAERGMALVLITHDLRVAFSVCDRINVLYAGSLLEHAPSSGFEAEPLHPYSLGLLMSEPPMDHRADALRAIPGSVPAPDAVAGRCAFVTRCRWAAADCELPQRLSVVEAGRSSACGRLPEIRSAMRTVRAGPSHAPTQAGVPLGKPLITVSDVGKEFRRTHRTVTALDSVTLQVAAGQSVGVVGESGSGKCTLARIMLGLETPSRGSVMIDGNDATDWSALPADRQRDLRRTVQMVFQDPYSSLNPRRSVGRTLAEAVSIGEPGGRDTDARVLALLDSVGLPADYTQRRPAALSGGERQRVSIARALAVRPRLVICDEPVSALDVSVQAQILNLLAELRRSEGLAYLFITHDLAVVRQVADAIHVLQSGRIVESGSTADVLDAPRHPYTRALLAAVPRPDRTANAVLRT
ncbi:dipeptide ABC transporter ATP-binding protein [Gordonia hongkongensis]|uniref:dipeptide ABC transporter ATP-binding protein n=1 Tax=Gordonia hongkongensis TaxID=1701090 RepID=UPI003EB8DC11